MYSIVGVMRVVTTQGIWVAPPQRAVWIPAGIEHWVEATREFDLCTLYVATRFRTNLPNSCRVVAIPSLMKELLRRAASFGNDYPSASPQLRLLTVLMDELTETLPKLHLLGLHLPAPQDRRLQRITQALQAAPGQTTTLAQWGTQVGASARTLERLFQVETGMSFAAWRAQARLMVALDNLGWGQSVTQAAFAAGYEDVSSFITMFKKALGTTPKAYFKD